MSEANGLMTAEDVVLEARGLTVEYGTGPSALRAVDAVTLSLHRGEVLGVVGESGCGKSTLAYTMTRLLRPPGLITAGELLYHARDGKLVNILTLSDRELRRFRWEQLAIVFQSAMNALNPVISLRTQLGDVLNAHRPRMTKQEREDRIHELLRTVGISPQRAGAYPREPRAGCASGP